VKLLVNNKEFRKFNAYKVGLRYNAVASTFEFTGLKGFLDNPLSYPDCKIYDDDNDLIITGTILSPSLTSRASVSLVNYSGYSLPGILEDVNVPVSLYPLQSDNLSLKDICDKLLNPFDISYVYTDNVSDDFFKVYKKVNYLLSLVKDIDRLLHTDKAINTLKSIILYNLNNCRIHS